MKHSSVMYKGPFTLSVSVSYAKIMGTEYYQWYHSHWLSEIIATHAGKRQIFTKDFARNGQEYPITLASIAITKDLIFCNAIAKLSVNGT